VGKGRGRSRGERVGGGGPSVRFGLRLATPAKAAGVWGLPAEGQGEQCGKGGTTRGMRGGRALQSAMCKSALPTHQFSYPPPSPSLPPRPPPSPNHPPLVCTGGWSGHCLPAQPAGVGVDSSSSQDTPQWPWLHHQPVPAGPDHQQQRPPRLPHTPQQPGW